MHLSLEIIDFGLFLGNDGFVLSYLLTVMSNLLTVLSYLLTVLNLFLRNDNSILLYLVLTFRPFLFTTDDVLLSFDKMLRNFVKFSFQLIIIGISLATNNSGCCNSWRWRCSELLNYFFIIFLFNFPTSQILLIS